MRVLYSFPHKLGASRICYTAWEQVRGVAAAGAEVILYAGCVVRDVPPTVEVHTTLSRGKLRIPYKLIGSLRALALHDWIVSRALPKLKNRIDVVHVWPSSALRTIRAARALGIPTVLERPSAHTRFALEVVAAEYKRVGLLKPHWFYRARPANQLHEENEFRSCDFLLCASDFSARTFVDAGYASSKILRHRYGFDDKVFFPASGSRGNGKRFTALFAGFDGVGKGLHIALEAWLDSPASRDGILQICDEIEPEFARKFESSLSHPSIVRLGFRDDIPRLMRDADVLLMPSLQEGFGLVCAEAIGSGCVPLASDACTEMCRHLQNALIHRVGDVATLRQQITDLYSSPELLARLRANAIASRADWTWARAGQVLAGAYDEAAARSLHPAGLLVRMARNA